MSIRALCMSLLSCCALCTTLVGDELAPTRCELIPLPEHQVSFQIDGVEKTRWHFGREYRITYFDHPDNLRYPTCWHVREDGWMGAAFCLQEGFVVARDHPLTLRYLLYAHSGSYNGARAEAVHAEFAARPKFEVTKSTQPHYQYTAQRKKIEDDHDLDDRSCVTETLCMLEPVR